MRATRYLLLSVVILWQAAAGVGSASEYCVDPGGSDTNPGTEAGPWKTIQKAADTLVAGDTVYIKAGTYHERVMPKNSGTPGQYITYAAYRGHEVNVDGAGLAPASWTGLFHLKDKSWIRVSGFRIVNSGFFGVCVSGKASHIIIEKNYLRNCQSSGIHVRSGLPGAPLTDIQIADNEVTETNTNHDQEGISVCGADSFEVRSNHVHHIYKEGIDAKEGCANGRIHGNYVHHLLGFQRAAGIVLSTVGIYVDTYGATRNIEVSENLAHNCGNAFAVASETGDPCENIRFFNNIAYNNQHGFTVGWDKPGPRNIQIVNNVAYANRGTGVLVSDKYSENIVVRNNICSQNREAQIVVARAIEQNVLVDHNLVDAYRGSKELWKAEASMEVQGTNAVVGDPRFVNPVGGDFHLRTNSPALGAGSSVGAPEIDHDGKRRRGRTDIGAY